LDWTDRDKDEHLSGAESDYYERLSPPYEAKNSWIDDMSELLLVRGVTPEVFWGTSSSNHPIAAIQMRETHGLHLDQEPLNYPVGLYDLFTPLSSGRLNVNTAPITTLQMVPGLDTNLAWSIVQHRAGPDGQDGTGDDIPYTQPGDIASAIGQVGISVQQMSAYLGVSSSVFEVHVDCQIAGFHREYIALVYRQTQRDMRILTMYWKPPNASGSMSDLSPNYSGEQ
jgi:type II secretory pathway component PulK